MKTRKHRSKSVRDKISETMILKGVGKGESNSMYGVHLHHFGKDAPFYNKHHTKKWKKEQMKAMSGKNNPMFGRCGKKSPMFGKRGKDTPMFNKYHSEETKKVMRENRLGEKNSNWKGGITSLSMRIKDLQEYVQWRHKVFARDNFTCQECWAKSGNGKAVYLEAHHTPKPFAEIFAEFLEEYNQFSPYDDKETLVRLAMKYEPFWEVDNGRTLCKRCHQKLHGLIKNYV